MTKAHEAQAIIYGSFVLYFIDALLSTSEKVKGSTIRLKQALMKHTRKREYLPYVVLSNDVWDAVLQKYKNKNMHVAIFDAVESLIFANEKIMQEMYGEQILQYSANFSLKQTPDKSIDKQILKESREIVKALKEETQRVVYNYLKEKKQ